MSWNLFVVAEPAEAKTLVGAKPDDPRWAWTWTDHDTATLGILGAVLLGAEIDDDAIGFLEWSCLASENGDEGPWVWALPEPLLRAMRAMRDPASVAATWAAVDFMSFAKPDDLEAFLVILQKLIAEAEGSGRSVLFWQQS